MFFLFLLTFLAAQTSGYIDDDIDMDIGEDEEEQPVEEAEPIINPTQIKVKPNFDPRVKASMLLLYHFSFFSFFSLFPYYT